jgi:hypothetical protein
LSEICELHHTPRVGVQVIAVLSFPEEATMRPLIESLTPDEGQIYWRRVGGIFVLYVVLMVTAAGVFVSHESARKIAHETVTTVASGAKLRLIFQSSTQAPNPAQRVADSY